MYFNFQSLREKSKLSFFSTFNFHIKLEKKISQFIYVILMEYDHIPCICVSCKPIAIRIAKVPSVTPSVTSMLDSIIQYLHFVKADIVLDI